LKNEGRLKKSEAPKGHTKLQVESSTSTLINGTTESFAGKSFGNTTSKPKTASTKPDSITKVNLVPAGFAGRRRVVGIRIDENLYRRFKPIAQAYFGSVCRPIEAFMASIIAISEMGVNFGNTIEVKEIRIERNIRARRALVVEKPNECGFVDCHEVAVASGVWRDKRELLLCEKHLAEAKSNPREWKVI